MEIESRRIVSMAVVVRKSNCSIRCRLCNRIVWASWKSSQSVDLDKAILDVVWSHECFQQSRADDEREPNLPLIPPMEGGE
jgi:hypothetical protein